MGKGRNACPWYRGESRCWYAWHNGKQVRLHPDKEEAFRLWHGLKAEREPEPTGPTVAEVIDAYLEHAELRLKPSTLRSKRKVLGRLKADKGTIPATSFTADVARAWLCAQAGWHRSLRWLACCILRTCWRWAVPSLVPTDTLQGLKMPPPLSRGADAVIEPDEHARIMEVAPDGIREAFFALHATGCRPCEVCQVTAQDFDAQAGAWVLREHKTDRKGSVRVILLPPALVEVCKLQALRYPEGPLFRNSKGGVLTPDRLRNWLFKARRRLKLPGLTPYGYRHAFATQALIAGVPDAHVAALMGHQGTTMLHKHYSHLGAKAQALREALNKVRS